MSKFWPRKRNTVYLDPDIFTVPNFLLFNAHRLILIHKNIERNVTLYHRVIIMCWHYYLLCLQFHSAVVTICIIIMHDIYSKKIFIFIVSSIWNDISEDFENFLLWLDIRSETENGDTYVSSFYQFLAFWDTFCSG